MVRTTDGLLFALVLVGFANWQTAVPSSGTGELTAFGGAGIAAIVVLLELFETEE